MENSMRKRKPVFKTIDGTSYAVSIKAISSNDFFSQPFGRQLDDHKIIRGWKITAKIGHVGTKGKSTMAAVKRWIKERGATEFYAKWGADSSYWKNDSVEIHYK